jgi:hypothetical protein
LRAIRIPLLKGCRGFKLNEPAVSVWLLFGLVLASGVLSDATHFLMERDRAFREMRQKASFSGLFCASRAFPGMGALESQCKKADFSGFWRRPCCAKAHGLRVSANQNASSFRGNAKH